MPLTPELVKSLLAGLQQLETVLTCHVCKEVIEEDNAVTLNCAHHVCEQCASDQGNRCSKCKISYAPKDIRSNVVINSAVSRFHLLQDRVNAAARLLQIPLKSDVADTSDTDMLDSNQQKQRKTSSGQSKHSKHSKHFKHSKQSKHSNHTKNGKTSKNNDNNSTSSESDTNPTPRTHGSKSKSKSTSANNKHDDDSDTSDDEKQQPKSSKSSKNKRSDSNNSNSSSSSTSSSNAQDADASGMRSERKEKEVFVPKLICLTGFADEFGNDLMRMGRILGLSFNARWVKNETDMIVSKTNPEDNRPYMTFKVLASILCQIPIVNYKFIEASHHHALQIAQAAGELDKDGNVGKKGLQMMKGQVVDYHEFLCNYRQIGRKDLFGAYYILFGETKMPQTKLRILLRIGGAQFCDTDELKNDKDVNMKQKRLLLIKNDVSQSRALDLAQKYNCRAVQEQWVIHTLYNMGDLTESQDMQRDARHELEPITEVQDIDNYDFEKLVFESSDESESDSDDDDSADDDDSESED